MSSNSRVILPMSQLLPSHQTAHKLQRLAMTRRYFMPCR